MNYIQKIIEDFDFNSIQNDNDKAGSFAENTLGAINLDLPSGTLWCKCNLGANTETDCGDYYAWGELITKNVYTDKNYTYKDNPKQLPLEYDVATKILGNNYSIPTKEQCKELIKYTDSEWVENYKGSGVNGQLFVSKLNGNSIFIPAAGYRGAYQSNNVGSDGHVWLSSLNVNFPISAQSFYFLSGAVGMSSYDRFYGFSIRPVFKK